MTIETPSQPRAKFKLCIVAHNAYGAMVGGRTGFIGGVEKQVTVLGRWFAAQGYPTSLVTWDEGGPPDEAIDGIRILKVCRETGGLPGLRFLHPKWTYLNRALRRADADIYYHNCGECVTGQIALWCRRHGRKFVYAVSSDPDCDARLPEFTWWRDRVLYRYGLRHADRLIVQTQVQRDLLRKSFGAESVVCPTPTPRLPNDEQPATLPQNGNPPRVLWIGRVTGIKRPDLLLEIARLCPEYAFDLVGPSDGSDYARRVLERAKTIPNIRCHGPVERDRVGEFYRQAAVLCSTSAYEGFANTFIEAWNLGLPVVATVDPDHLLTTRHMGHCGQSVPELVEAIHALIRCPDRWRQASENARRYFFANHEINIAARKIESIFHNLVTMEF